MTPKELIDQLFEQTAGDSDKTLVIFYENKITYSGIGRKIINALLKLIITISTKQKIPLRFFIKCLEKVEKINIAEFN